MCSVVPCTLYLYIYFSESSFLIPVHLLSLSPSLILKKEVHCPMVTATGILCHSPSFLDQQKYSNKHSTAPLAVRSSFMRPQPEGFVSHKSINHKAQDIKQPRPVSFKQHVDIHVSLSCYHPGTPNHLLIRADGGHRKANFMTK